MVQRRKKRGVAADAERGGVMCCSSRGEGRKRFAAALAGKKKGKRKHKAKGRGKRGLQVVE